MRKLAEWPYPKIMAHRCGGALAPENTLPGLRLAALAGCGGVEFDVMLSAAGTPALIHDETLERTTSGNGKVSAAHDEVLFSVDAGIKHHRAFVGTRVPRFDEAIQLCRALGLFANVEIKPATGFERQTGATVAQAAMAGWADAGHLPILSSFSETALGAAMMAVPRLPRGLLFERLPADWKSRCEKLAVIAVHLNGRHLDQATAKAIKAEGYRLLTYTENDPHFARTLLGWGVDTVVTDRPDIVRA